MKSSEREAVYAKYNGHCAYCGKGISIKQMQVDHIEPTFRGWSEEELSRYNVKRGADHIDNYNPACARCNKRKNTFTVEQFREEISEQVTRLNKYVPGFRLAVDYGLIDIPQTQVKFYFEKIQSC